MDVKHLLKKVKEKRLLLINVKKLDINKSVELINQLNEMDYDTIKPFFLDIMKNNLGNDFMNMPFVNELAKFNKNKNKNLYFIFEKLDLEFTL